MTDSYNYRPKFTDIRIRKPMAASKVKEEIRPCEAEGCIANATCKAPKSKTNPLEVWWFCAKHAAEYNKNWNFFEGMSDGEQKAFQEAERHGHRPTWNFGAKGGSRESATIGANNRFAGSQSYLRPRVKKPANQQNVIPPNVKKAYEELGLETSASAANVRSTYADLVRKFHPDSNGGDRSAEAKLTSVVKAYKILKTAKRA